MLRFDDRLRLFELHPTDFRILESYMKDRPNSQVSDKDGFVSLKGELPPPSRRAVVLMDPSYEIKSDYAKVLAALREPVIVVLRTSEVHMMQPHPASACDPPHHL